MERRPAVLSTERVDSGELIVVQSLQRIKVFGAVVRHLRIRNGCYGNAVAFVLHNQLKVLGNHERLVKCLLAGLGNFGPELWTKSGKEMLMLEESFHVSASFSFGGFLVIGVDSGEGSGEGSGSSGIDGQVAKFIEMIIWD